MQALALAFCCNNSWQETGPQIDLGLCDAAKAAESLIFDSITAAALNAWLKEAGGDLSMKVFRTTHTLAAFEDHLLMKEATEGWTEKTALRKIHHYESTAKRVSGCLKHRLVWGAHEQD